MGTQSFPFELSRPGFWPQPGPVETMETHISWIFLVGDRAYKLKKPVDFGFVDFSTIEKRRFFCEEEMRLNRRLAPDLYLGTRSIQEHGDQVQLDGPGEPIDFVVEMRRFDQEAVLANLEAAGELSEDHVEKLAAVVADFHANAPAAACDDRFGSHPAVARPVEENFRHLLSGKTSAENEARLYRLRDWAREEHAMRMAVFDSRKEGGRIRECHGDLHLGNILARNGTITLFDCIEFNEEFRWIDVLSDVAFCAMDLASRGRDTLARFFLNRYLENTGDYEGLPVLPYYLSYRAMVRAKVAWLRLQEDSGGRKPAIRADYEEHLSLAERYAFRRSPRLIVMHGLSGTGESVGSEQIVRELGAIRVRSDLERKRLGRDHPDQDLYSAEMTRKIYERLHRAAAWGLEAGFTVILDATYLKKKDRADAIAVARRLTLPWHLVEVTAPEETLRQRILQRRKQNNDPSDATIDVLTRQTESIEPLTGPERDRSLTVHTDQTDCWSDTIASLRRDNK